MCSGSELFDCFDDLIDPNFLIFYAGFVGKFFVCDCEEFVFEGLDYVFWDVVMRFYNNFFSLWSF